MNDILEAIRPHLAIALTWVVVGGIGGAIVGWIKNRVLRGVVLGATLGPVGWIIVGVLEGNFRDCPACSRPIRVQALTCRHCGASVARVEARSARSSLKGTETAKRPW